MLSIQHLNPNPEQVDHHTLSIVQALFEASPRYFLNIAGEPCSHIEALKGHPDKSTVYIGLHLVSDKYQGQGWGSKTYELLEAEVRLWLHVTKLRLGVALTNPVADFWMKMGFHALPGLKKTMENTINSQVFEMEKLLENL